MLEHMRSHHQIKYIVFNGNDAVFGINSMKLRFRRDVNRRINIAAMMLDIVS